jgi:hypothetical protein
MRAKPAGVADRGLEDQSGWAAAHQSEDRTDRVRRLEHAARDRESRVRGVQAVAIDT